MTRLLPNCAGDVNSCKILTFLAPRFSAALIRSGTDPEREFRQSSENDFAPGPVECPQMRVRSLALGAVAVMLAAGAAGWWMLRSANGFSTRAEPSAIERLTTRAARRWAVPASARSATNPLPFSPQVWADARAHFADHCASCHANDGS